MADKKKPEGSSVNVYFQQEENHEDEVVISLSAFFRKLKKYFLVWFLVSVIIGGLVVGFSIFSSTTSSKPVRALVSFNYDGIEKGKNPDGTDFDATNLKNPVVIEAALSDCNMDISILEAVRSGIRIDGRIPEDTLKRLTGYFNVFEKASNGMPAVQSILDESWYSTQYIIQFDFKAAGLSRSDAVQLLNSMLDEYRSYFFKSFGYNEPLGSALGALNYEDYDYAEAIDMFSDSLVKLNRYISNLSASDTTRFRSSVTGYTFADLRDTINTINQIDLDLISSYITVNNVTKDKERVKAYYEYRIDTLKRQQTEYAERLASLEESISAYVKDDIYIFGNGTDGVNTQTTVASEQYDKMIAQKITAQSDLSHTTQQIEYYNQRLQALRKTVVGTTDKKKKVEEDLKKLHEKIMNLTQLVEQTADDYYRNVSLSNAYSILMPASSDVATTVTNGVKSALLPLVGLELIMMMGYLSFTFISALIEETRKKRLENAAAAAEDQKEAEES